MGVGLYSMGLYTLRLFDGGLARALRQRAPLAQRLPTLAKAVAWLSLAWGTDATAWEACLESCKGLFELSMAVRDDPHDDGIDVRQRGEIGEIHL